MGFEKFFWCMSNKDTGITMNMQHCLQQYQIEQRNADCN